MRITQLTPGTAHFFCGSCLRDSTLAVAMRKRGHDVTLMPLYLPLVQEEAGPNPALNGDDRVFMGGINLYLQHKWPALRRLPRWLVRLLDTPGLLRFSAARADMTDASKLGDMTLSMIRGDLGRQRHELAKLTRWMAEHDRPDVVFLNNALLAGMARPIKDALGAPVVCTLHGEDTFLDGLPSPAREQAWETLAERVRDVDAFVAVSAYYAGVCRDRLGLDADRVHVVHNGIDLDHAAAHAGAGAAGDDRDAVTAPTVGYLARMCPEKGLHVLVDAFLRLRERGAVDGPRLRVAGAMLAGDRRFVRGLRARLDAAGADVEFLPNVDRDGKWRFLRSLDVLSVPATYGESFGLYVLEALAVGVPVVQPRHGAFPELVEATGGGVLCAPDDPDALAEAIEALLLDPDRARALAERGRHAVADSFTSDHMARGVERVCTMVAPCPTSSP
jgi:glycosyltransferase involved in cell wall biosynthesis